MHESTLNGCPSREGWHVVVSELKASPYHSFVYAEVGKAEMSSVRVKFAGSMVGHFKALLLRLRDDDGYSLCP